MDDKTYISELYENYCNLMYKTAFQYIEDIHEAEDIVQESWINLIEKLPTIRTLGKNELIAYIVSTVKNKALNYLKKMNRQSKEMAIFEDGEDIQNIPGKETAEEIALHRYNAEILHKAMSELKPKYKYILVSKYYHDMTDKEIAEKMDMSPDNIRQHLARAKRELKKIVALQKYSGGSWQQEDSWSASGTGTNKIAKMGQKYVVHGRYRVVSTAKVYSLSGALLETQECISSEFIY